ncbi:hypothetical protein D1AOALGA4SA_13075 [Olavius algarvensis Delta 1 endosymbiont]|nr:hypothetical protein D1AOALGA4SA_13075 [Olavius algarvensis Delta 1 endosymbiont]
MTEIPKTQPMHNIERRKFSCFGHWVLGFEIYLYFGAWYLEFID